MKKERLTIKIKIKEVRYEFDTCQEDQEDHVCVQLVRHQPYPDCAGSAIMSVVHKETQQSRYIRFDGGRTGTGNLWIRSSVPVRGLVSSFFRARIIWSLMTACLICAERVSEALKSLPDNDVEVQADA